MLPEYAIRATGDTASAAAIRLSDPGLAALGAKAREHKTWVVVPMILREEAPEGRSSNAAVLFSRTGTIAGIYRKVHPVADESGALEMGTTPGRGHPVFECDFGRLGILICWATAYELPGNA